MPQSESEPTTVEIAIRDLETIYEVVSLAYKASTTQDLAEMYRKQPKRLTYSALTKRLEGVVDYLEQNHFPQEDGPDE